MDDFVQLADTDPSRNGTPMTSGSSRAARVRGPSPNPTDRGQPRDGDVIVSRESTSGNTYAVRQHPGDVQLHALVRDDAIRLARGFAVHIAVDLWYIDDGALTLLEAYRKG
jgi:hypothetical protein